MEQLRPGDLMFGPIGGIVPGFFPVGIGQLLLAGRKERMTWRRWWHVRHVGMVVNAGTAPRMVQAMPSGAEEIDMSVAKHWTRHHVYVRPPYAGATDSGTGEKFVGAGYQAARAARRYVSTPYNFLTYGALAARAIHLPVSERVFRRWISTRADMMCSQLADQALADAGYHVFDDGRLPQDVVPAELFRKLITTPGAQCMTGGDMFGERWIDGTAWRAFTEGL